MKKIEPISPELLFKQGRIDEEVMDIKRGILEMFDNYTTVRPGIYPEHLWEYFTSWTTSNLGNAYPDFQIDCDPQAWEDMDPSELMEKYRKALRKYGVRSRLNREGQLTFTYAGFAYVLEQMTMSGYVHIVARKDNMVYKYPAEAGSARAILALGRIIETARPWVERLQNIISSKHMEEKIQAASCAHYA